MKHLLFLLFVATFHQSALAAVYKCEYAGGKVEYRSLPCENGRQVSSISTNSVAPKSETSVSSSSVASREKRVCVGKEVRINFTSMPVKSTLQVLADFSGNKLAADPSISGAGAFNYECVPWETVLQDIASRHSLLVKVENGTIFATKR